MIGGDLYELGLCLLANGSDLAEAPRVEAAAGWGVDGAGHHAFQDMRVRRYSLSTMGMAANRAWVNEIRHYFPPIPMAPQDPLADRSVGSQGYQILQSYQMATSGRW